MNLEEAQKRLGIVLPDRHKAAMTDPKDPIHEETLILVLESPYESLRWVETNDFLRSSDWDPWPEFLVAFASNGCGDYFAYDLRSEPYKIIYMDPDNTVEENLDLGAEDKLNMIPSKNGMRTSSSNTNSEEILGSRALLGLRSE